MTNRRHNSRKSLTIDRNAVRDWTAYTVKLDDGTYYNGITSYKDVSRRIGQHGGRKGAQWTRGKKVVEVVKIRHLGKMPRRKAEEIENQITLENRKRYGYRRVRGGYDTRHKASLIPTYTPGSKESIIFVLVGLAVAVALVCMMAALGYSSER